MEDINYKIINKSLILSLPTKNKGKFRWKNRDSNSSYGEVFATTTIPFSTKSYLEWQIGYDAEVNHDTKRTILPNLEFQGANKKQKNPYELSEIIYLLLDNKIVTKKEVDHLIKDIESKDFSFDEEYQIKNTQSTDKIIEGIKFHRQDIILPTFSYYKSPQDLSIEVSIQKQQYASGVQPMVYFTIPIVNFANSNKMIGKLSSQIDTAELVVNESNSDIFIKMVSFFGLCSWKHKHDVLSILKLLS